MKLVTTLESTLSSHELVAGTLNWFTVDDLCTPVKVALVCKELQNGGPIGKIFIVFIFLSNKKFTDFKK